MARFPSGFTAGLAGLLALDSTAVGCVLCECYKCSVAGYTILSIDLRKLAVIDIAFLGRKAIVAEYAAGVVLSTALGLFVLVRGHSFWQILLGVYFLCLGINYAPMLAYAITIPAQERARKEMGGELADRGKAMSKYRRLSLLLLIPLVVPLLTLLARRKINSK